MSPEHLATEGDAVRGRFGPLLVVASLVCGVIAPLVASACIVVLAIPTGIVFGLAALLATVSLIWTCWGRRVARFRPFVVGVLATGSLVAGAGTAVTAWLTFAFGDWRRPLTSATVFMIVFVVASALATIVYAIQAGKAVRAIHRWRASSRIGFALGVCATLASPLVGAFARERIDQHCAAVIIAEGESGVPRIAVWKPLAPCLRLRGVLDAYRDRALGDSSSPGPDSSELWRAYRSFMGHEMDDSF